MIEYNDLMIYFYLFSEKLVETWENALKKIDT
jgi:hypothetical protein